MERGGKRVFRRESDYQEYLIKKIQNEVLPGSIVIDNDGSYIQGWPDLTILYGPYWAALECKKSLDEPFRPNQEYYIDICNRMAFGSMICPEIEEEVLDELQHALEPNW